MTPIRNEFCRLEHTWNEAVIHRDAAALRRMFARAFVYTDENGCVSTRNETIASVISGELVMTEATLHDISVHRYDAAVVVTGCNKERVRFRGIDVSGRYRFTDTFVRQSGVWRCVATHECLVAERLQSTSTGDESYPRGHEALSRARLPPPRRLRRPPP
jgi:hypothetical protein